MFNRIYLQLKTDLPQILNCQTKLHFFFNSIIYKQIVCLSENQKNRHYLWLIEKKKLGY